MPGGAVTAVAGAAYDQLNGPKQWLDIAGGHLGWLYCPAWRSLSASTALPRFLSPRLLSWLDTVKRVALPRRQSYTKLTTSCDALLRDRSENGRITP
jgi:hypothetical protein